MRWPFQRKSLANPGSDLAAIFAGGGFGSVSEAQALSVPAVSSAIRLISEAAATLTISVKKREGDTEVDAPGHPAAALLSGQVNTWTSSFEFIRDLIASALMADNGGLAVVTKVRGEPREIVAYRRGVIGVDYDTVTEEPSYNNGGQIVKASTVVHLRAPFCRAPLTLAREAIAVAKAMESFASGLWKNGARPSGFLTSEKNHAPAAVENLKAAWQAAFGGGENAGKTPLLPDGLKYQQLTMTSTDSQFLENRKFQTIEIARIFRVPPSMLFELDRATWSNSEQMGKEFLSYSLAPWLRAVESALNRALFTPEERKLGYRVAFDEDDLTRADFGARSTAYSSAISARWLSPNDVRKYEGLPPYPGGHEYVNPNTGSSQPGANDNKPPKAIDDKPALPAA